MKGVSNLRISAASVYDIQVEHTKPIEHVWRMIQRDHQAVFGAPPLTQATGGTGAPVVIVRYAEDEDDCPSWPESYSFHYREEAHGTVLEIVGRDELGLIYGLLRYSHQVLGVDPFWFWSELEPESRELMEVAAEDYESEQPCVRYRGWFVNDEVCLIGWKEEYPPGEEVWLPVFEALLRCGGNMVIPGTDLPRTGIHHQLAVDMGLWVTHHHAEPLGAEMFLRAFPGKAPSYKEHPELFEQLWREAIERQRHDKILWVLSFRGQGDKPFWEDDPGFDTPAARGALISSVVRKQYDMLHEYVEQPVCCMAMYGEIAELYKQGHIEVPHRVIKIWADNGYGKMVSRRHGSTNHRVPALPAPEDEGHHGVYYHVTFHDLQASNHLTMFPAPSSLIADELGQAFAVGASDYLLVNSGNILPHLYTLDLVAELWQRGKASEREHLEVFIARNYTVCQHEIAALYEQYASSTIKYGPHADDRAGDEFYHHAAREIIGHWLRGQQQGKDSLNWAVEAPSLLEQVRWFRSKTEEAIPRWERLERQCAEVLEQLPPDERWRLETQLLVQLQLHRSGCQGLAYLCQAYEYFKAGDNPRSFIQASHAVWSYSEGKQALEHAAQGRWEHFYRADWLTNIDNTIGHADTVRRFVRIQGDSPDMFRWYKDFLMPETEKYIYLENTHRNPLPDDELARRLEEVL